MISLLCSAIQEWIASAVGLRSRNLRKGIDNLLGAKIAKAFYDHGLLKSLYREPGMLGVLKRPLGERGVGPSYIEPRLFADVLIDVLDRGDDKSALERQNAVAKSFQEIESQVASLPAGQVRETLLTLLADADQKANIFREKAAEWFDAAMDRVSGWYARTVQVWLFVIATVLVVLFNADAIEVGTKLWKDEALRAAMVAAAQENAGTDEAAANMLDPGQALSILEKFPIGWGCKKSEESNRLCFCENFRGLQSFVGWFITIVACSFGAPFWFGLLGKVVALRGAGKAPTKPDQSTAKT